MSESKKTELEDQSVDQSTQCTCDCGCQSGQECCCGEDCKCGENGCCGKNCKCGSDCKCKQKNVEVETTSCGSGCGCHDADSDEDDLELIVESPLELAKLMWPDSVIFDDRVFLMQPDPDNYKELLVELDGDKTTAQALFNHFHLIEIFGMATREELIDAGYRLHACWQFCLGARYPERKITVAFDPQEEDALDELQIVVYEDLQA